VRWREAGATHLAVSTLGEGLAGVDAHIEALGALAAVLLPA
jgi:hypothetical protein